eukprot:TRINITY_DN11743_c1_g1_i1.p1 TRINITY_DN11743_c1_g1~~TRINITY_DN11743_c1_g1_i1.p1  ORF type:complete len:816 (-),score=154.83 TRINITY_DN11743_c1_g1_i1:332-2779(-)
MVGVGGGPAAGEVHPALASLRHGVLPAAVRAASLQVDLDALIASCEVLDAMLALVTELSSAASGEVLVPLLAAMLESFVKLPKSASSGDLTRWSELIDVHSALLGALHAAYKSCTLFVSNTGLFDGLITVGAQILAVSGPSGSLAQYSDGALLSRGLDAWEALAKALRGESDAEDFGAPGPAGPMMPMVGGPPPTSSATAGSPETQAAASRAFSMLLEALPAALVLPAELEDAPEDWEMSQLRLKATQTLLVWCDDSPERIEKVVQKMSAVFSHLALQPGAQLGAKWAELELALWFAAAAAEVVAAAPAAVDEGTPPLPSQLKEVLKQLPRLPLGADNSTASRSTLLCAAASEVLVSLDPWVTAEAWPLSAAELAQLLQFLLSIAGAPGARGATGEALVVVVSNLAMSLTTEGSAPEMMKQLAVLCYGAHSKLPVPRRERLIRSALGPLLSRLEPDDRLEAAVDELTAPLRAAAPVSSCAQTVQGETPDAAVRLLCITLSAPEPPSGVDLSLRLLSKHWAWIEACLTAWVSSEPAVEASCNAVTQVLARARSNPSAAEVLKRVLPLWGAAVTRHGSAPCLAATAQMALVFRGGSAFPSVQEEFARQVLAVAETLLAGGPQRACQLPADVLVALIELFANAMAPRCVGLVSVLLGHATLLSTALLCIARMLPSLTNPKAVCWSLILAGRLPQWTRQQQTAIQAGPVLQTVLGSFCDAWCQLMASSSLARDAEVRSALAKSLLAPAQSGALPALQQSLDASMMQLHIPQDEKEVLLMQLGDPSTTEDSLAEALKDTVETWQAMSSRRWMLSASAAGA